VKLSFYIAKRYLFAKKSNNLINVITKISVTVIAVTSAALVLIMSVMNGMNQLVEDLYSNFSPDLIIEPSHGKSFDKSAINLKDIESLNDVKALTLSSETVALIKHDNLQEVAHLKSVDNDYFTHSGLNKHVRGESIVKSEFTNLGVLGIGLAYRLGINTKFSSSINVFVPGTQTGGILNQNKYFRSQHLEIGSTFSVNDEFDTKYCLVSHEYMSELLGNKDQFQKVEIHLKKDADAEQSKEDIKSHIGDSFIVKTRFEQHEFLFKSINAEKWVALLVLSFIMIIAFFNLSGSLIMLMIDKKKDTFVLSSMGLEKKSIKTLFFMEGLLITVFGTIIGLIGGSLLVWIQNTFEVVKIQGAFVVSSYPVKWIFSDILLIGAIVLIIGSISSFIPTRKVYA
jgi:ABC-type lipoprotein release transport system permease subunit